MYFLRLFRFRVKNLMELVPLQIPTEREKSQRERIG